LVRDIDAVSQLVAPADRLDLPVPQRAGPPSRRDLLDLLEGRSLTDLDPNVLAALASLDGAIVIDRQGRLLAAGAILRHPPSPDGETNGLVEGARTTAALAASRFGPVLKVSEDGIITFFEGERVWDI
jgi:DisA bacterial checkpoint controller nucleotide-binding